jgi:hypothetical protein
MSVRGAHVQLQLTLQLEPLAADGAVELLLPVLRLHASVTPGSVLVQRNHLDEDRQVNFSNCSTPLRYRTFVTSFCNVLLVLPLQKCRRFDS